MPALVVPKVASEKALDLFIRGVNGYSGWEIHLYANDVTPDRNTVKTDLTEAAFTGYAFVLQDPTSGSIALDGADHAVYSDPTPCLFQPTGGTFPQDVYGYYVTTQGFQGRDLIYVQRFDSAPFQFLSINDILEVLVNFSFYSEFP